MGEKSCVVFVVKDGRGGYVREQPRVLTETPTALEWYELLGMIEDFDNEFFRQCGIALGS